MFIHVCTLSPIFNSDKVPNFPFLYLTTDEDGKQPPLPDGGGGVVGTGN